MSFNTVESLDLGDGNWLVVTTTWNRVVFRIDTLAIDPSEASLGSLLRTVDTPVGTGTQVVTDADPTVFAGQWNESAQTLIFERKFAVGAWSQLPTPEAHTLTANADRTHLVLDGEISQSFELVP